MKKVWIEKIKEALLIKPKPSSWDDFFYNTPNVTEDFSTERQQQAPQNRDDLFK